MSDSDKVALNTVVESIASKIERAQTDNNCRIPYGFVVKEIDAANVLFPSMNITRHHIHNMLRRRRAKLSKSPLPLSNSPTPPTAATPLGRPTGTTDKRKCSEQMNIVAAKVEICKTYRDELDQHKQAHVYDDKIPNFPTGRLVGCNYK